MNATAILTEQDKTRFWSKVLVLGEDECWIWTGCCDVNGYGHLTLNGKTWRAHRLAYLLANGFIPEGMQINHRCNNRKCVNPRHLKTGTHQDNSNDMTRAGRQATGETHGRTELTDAQVSEIRNLYATGDYSQREIGERFGVASNTISFIIAGKTWVHAGGASDAWQGERHKGEKNVNAKLDAAKVREIRALHAQGGITYAALGRHYGVSNVAIRNAVKRISWKHI